MKYLLIPLLSVMALTKITLQARFSKHAGTGLPDRMLFNAMMFAAGALPLLPMLATTAVSAATVGAGAAMGVLSAAFQLSYVCAFAKGNMALTVLINNFSMLLPTAVSAVALHEPFGAFKILGTALAVGACCLSAAPTPNAGKKSANSAWLALTLLSFLCNGLIGITQKVYATRTAPQVFAFVAVAYLTAAAAMLPVWAVARRRQPAAARTPLSARALLPGAAVGVLLGAFQCVNTYANGVLPGTLLYPAYNCTVSALTALVGRFLFRERLTPRQWLGVAVGTAAVAVLCI